MPTISMVGPEVSGVTTKAGAGTRDAFGGNALPTTTYFIEAELTRNDRTAAGAEIGDLLFAVVNLARHVGTDPEAALRGTNRKFERRFAAIERVLDQRGKTPAESTLAEMDDLWNAAKVAEAATDFAERKRGT